VNPTARRWLRVGAFAAFGIAALIGWLGAGLLVFISFQLTAQSGQEIPVGVLQVLSLVGWLAILIWLVVDLGRSNPRFVLAPFAAWLWVYLVLIFLSYISSLGIGI
jgi:hypothetical protein